MKLSDIIMQNLDENGTDLPVRQGEKDSGCIHAGVNSYYVQACSDRADEIIQSEFIYTM